MGRGLLSHMRVFTCPAPRMCGAGIQYANSIIRFTAVSYTHLIDRMHDLQVGALIGRLFERVGKLGVAVEHLGRNAGERHAGDAYRETPQAPVEAARLLTAISIIAAPL